MMRSIVYCVQFFLLVTSHAAFGCFPMQDVFEHSNQWAQDLKTPWKRLHVIGQEADNVIKEETQSAGGSKQATVTCLKNFPKHRYLVKIEEDGKPRRFACFRFTPLSRQVVRRAKTKLHRNLMKVNCDKEAYTEEEEVMIAYLDMLPEACPLNGGYQMLLHEGVTVRAHCLDTIQTYNPRFEFACNGDHAMADFGKDCAPVIPKQGQNFAQFPFAYLQCVASWDESSDGSVKAVLLQMKNDPSSFWCMHYKLAEGNNDELLTIYLSFNGKCTARAFNSNHEMPGDNSMFGTLAKYVPTSDKRCYDASYIKKCRFNEARCFEAHDCPLDCQRCNKKVAKRDCGFIDAIGHWTSMDQRHGLTVDVKSQGFKVTEYGIFSCWGPAEYKPQVNVYSVVRNDPYSACLPFYACAKIDSPSKGVLFFYLRPAARDSQTGEPLSCEKHPDGLGSIVPSDDKKLVTLVSKHDLPRVSCNIDRDMIFPSRLANCRFALKRCTDFCKTLHADYDRLTCDNKTRFEIEHEHICHARLRLRDNVQAIITSSVLNERYLCWIYTAQRLFITVPENCNTEGAERIFSDEQALRKYDPFFGISLPQESSVVDNRNDASTNFVGCLLTIFTVIMSCIEIYL